MQNGFCWGPIGEPQWFVVRVRFERFGFWAQHLPPIAVFGAVYACVGGSHVNYVIKSLVNSGNPTRVFDIFNWPDKLLVSFDPTLNISQVAVPTLCPNGGR
jgi:hypothetical protein